jgi:O-acetyl-ADP-ribose deacetylase (regulator of RNase III)
VERCSAKLASEQAETGTEGEVGNMPFEIVRNDITKMAVDAIVNTANPRPVIGPGTDSRIHEVAGPELLKARQVLGSIDVGHAVVTPAYQLNAKYVIHTVGPVWGGGSYGEEASLRSCYDNSLKLAVENKCSSVAFPLISTGNYGFPKDKALQIAISAFSTFLLEHEMQIYLVVFDRTSFKLSEKLFQSVASYIDEHYVDACERAAYGIAEENRRRRIRRQREMEICESYAVREEMPAVGTVKELRPCASKAAPKTLSLEEMLKQTDAGFTQTLLNLIDKTGKKDSEVYKKANISKQHFSKIRNNPDYKPTKSTAIALALALELSLEETKDLIGRAGYALTNSSKFDLIIRFFIEQGNYNVVEINIALYEFDQSLLGN